jgi:serine/threonine protein kinase
MIEGVGELHKNDLIHRDLKMDNILIQSDMNIVICDFGLVVQCPQKDENGNDKKIN